MSTIIQNLRRQQLCHLYQLLKQSHYNHYIGEPVTQLEHFVLAGQIAEKYHPNDTNLITGAFLHDIGHQLQPMNMTDSKTGEILGVIDHEQIGANYLQKMGFSNQVVDCVRNHVKSKRYLSTTNPNYLKQLSPASQKTLQLQKGLMTPSEIKSFQTEPFFKQSLLTRYFDNCAKDRNQLRMPIETALDYYFKITCQSLINRTDI